MSSAFRRAASRVSRPLRTALAVVALAACIAPAATSATGARHTAPVTGSESAETTFRPEVRLRKLHLVRPDLIQYPIAYEVVC